MQPAPLEASPAEGARAAAGTSNKASSDVLVPIRRILLRLAEAAVLARQPRPVARFFVDQWRRLRARAELASGSRGRHGHAAEGRVAPHEAILRSPADERVAPILLGPGHKLAR